MHVLLLPSWYFPAGSEEIAGRMFQHHAQALQEMGMDARLLYIDHSVRKSPLYHGTEHLEDGVRTFRVQQWFPPKINRMLYSLWLDRCVKDLIRYIRQQGRPDVFHAQSYQAASIAARLQQKVQIPYIYTERLSGFILKTIPTFHIPFIREAMLQASVTTCVSPGLQQALQALSSKSVMVVPNFFDSGTFYPDPGVRKNDFFTFVSVGEPAHIKGLDILLKAFAQLKSNSPGQRMKLILIDRIPEQERLMELARTYHIEEHLEWTGLISQKQVAEILRQSHVLVSASRVETFGKAILEAQACGLPVIATSTDGARYILSSDAQGQLVQIEDMAGLMTAMAHVMTRYEQYDPMAIHNIVKDRFDKMIIVGQWVALYNSLQA